MADKTKMKDSKGRYLSHGLFLELGYKTDLALFTFDDEDKEHNGIIYPSLKKLYLEFGDVTEYEFSREYLLGWRHWQKLINNKAIRHQIDQWREELDLSIRAEAVRNIVDQASIKESFQAAKFLVDRGWDKRPAGRPSTADKQQALERDKRLNEELEGDVAILAAHRGK